MPWKIKDGKRQFKQGVSNEVASVYTSNKNVSVHFFLYISPLSVLNNKPGVIWMYCLKNCSLHFTRLSKKQNTSLVARWTFCLGSAPFQVVLICKILPFPSLWNHFQQLLQTAGGGGGITGELTTHSAVNTTYKCAVKPRPHTHKIRTYAVIHGVVFQTQPALY